MKILAIFYAKLGNRSLRNILFYHNKIIIKSKKNYINSLIDSNQKFYYNIKRYLLNNYSLA